MVKAKSTESVADIVNPVPETVLKRRKRLLEEQKKKFSDRKESSKLAQKKKTLYLKRAQKFANDYALRESQLENQRVQAMENGHFFVEPEAKLAIVIRVRGLKSVAPKAKKALRLLRLRQVNAAVFVKLNKASINMLKLVEPFVAWGYPSLDTVRKLLYKRGYIKFGGNRVAIQSNEIVEKVLGNKDVICLEDMLNQIYTVGDNFKHVNNALWPFKLRHPRHGYRSIKKHFVEGGDCGNREEYINELLDRMI